MANIEMKTLQFPNDPNIYEVVDDKARKGLGTNNIKNGLDIDAEKPSAAPTSIRQVNAGYNEAQGTDGFVPTDPNNFGTNSAAFGHYTKAAGDNGFACGRNTEATGGGYQFAHMMTFKDTNTGRECGGAVLVTWDDQSYAGLVLGEAIVDPFGPEVTAGIFATATNIWAVSSPGVIVFIDTAAMVPDSSSCMIGVGAQGNKTLEWYYETLITTDQVFESLR